MGHALCVPGGAAGSVSTVGAHDGGGTGMTPTWRALPHDDPHRNTSTSFPAAPAAVAVLGCHSEFARPDTYARWWRESSAMPPLAPGSPRVLHTLPVLVPTMRTSSMLRPASTVQTYRPSSVAAAPMGRLPRAT